MRFAVAQLALVVLASGCTAAPQEEAPAPAPAPASEPAPAAPSARVRITARDVAGQPLTATVWVGDTKIGEAGESLAAPEGVHRLRVAADGLGAFLEDVELVVGVELVRDVVLAPGPDMVRFPGGRFTMGPPADQLEQWPGIDRWTVELAPFDLDRTEVTVADYVACRKAAKRPFCNTAKECEGVAGCPYQFMRRPADPRDWVVPKNADLPLCNFHTGRPDLKVAPGRERHPANCVTRVEAEDYCRWAGKRLPTDAEWEFVARGITPTWAHERAGTSPVCASKTSAHGICDLMANVSEYVEDAKVPGRPPRPSRNIDGCRGSAWLGLVDAAIRPASCGDFEGMPWFGFRCARDVKPGG